MTKQAINAAPKPLCDCGKPIPHWRKDHVCSTQCWAKSLNGAPASAPTNVTAEEAAALADRVEEEIAAAEGDTTMEPHRSGAEPATTTDDDRSDHEQYVDAVIEQRRKLAADEEARRACEHCGGPIPAEKSHQALTCSDNCYRERKLALERKRHTGTASPGYKPRACVGCGQEFTPTANANRYCPACKAGSAKPKTAAHNQPLPTPDAEKGERLTQCKTCRGEFPPDQIADFSEDSTCCDFCMAGRAEAEAAADLETAKANEASEHLATPVEILTAAGFNVRWSGRVPAGLCIVRDGWAGWGGVAKDALNASGYEVVFQANCGAAVVMVVKGVRA